MKVVFHIISHFDLGGAERVAINIAKSNNSKIKFHLIEITRTDSLFREKIIEELKEANIHYHTSVLPAKKLSIILFPLRFISIYLRFRPTIIHSHSEIPDLSIWLFLMVCKLFGIKIKAKVVRTIHNTQLWSDWKRIGKYVEKYFIQKNSNIAISESVQESYYNRYFDYAPIIYNGIEIKNQVVFPTLQKGRINVLFAGRFEKQKGINQLIEVIRNLKNNSSFIFHIVGDGSLKNELYSALESFVNVRIYDKTHNLAAYLSSFDYVFMPSYFEGLPLLPIEASFSKTPTIINSCPGLEEVFPRNWPLKVKDNSVQEYIHIFNNILPNIDYNGLANVAFEFVSRQFSLEKMQTSYEQLYLSKKQINTTVN